MTAFYLVAASLLVGNVMLGLVRVARGPTPADRMMSSQLFGTTGVAVLVLLAEAVNLPALRDVALVFAILAVVATVAFVRRAWSVKVETAEEQS